MKRFFLFAAVLGSAFVPCLRSSGVAVWAEDEPIPKAIFRYVQRPEPDFSWKVVERSSVDGGEVTLLRLVSQKWHGIIWEHALEVYKPRTVRFPRHMLLFVTGGSQPPGPPSRNDMALGLKLAQLCQARVAVLHQVPNQPLLGNHKEDDLITETWLRYLQTGDETWPLLFPMVKSVVKAMDALQELSRSEWKQAVNAFVVTGASKRGWTSWLTPVVDKRVAAIAPMVIDVLNFRAQMRHQLDTWGHFSEQLHDYYSKGLIVVGEEKPRERQLRRMMDPYTYRKLLSLPKLLINGTNDRYWVVNAMSLYWDDLVGPKYVLQVPNAGHSLKGGRELVMATVSAFFRHVCMGRSLPQIEWKREDTEKYFRLVVTSSPLPKAARLWVATSDDLDFRDAKWSAHLVERSSDTLIGAVPRPANGHVAFYVELQFSFDSLPYSLCTVIQRE